MDPDQTVWEQSDLDPYCLPYRLHKNIRKEQMTKVVTGGLRTDRKQWNIRDQGSRVVRYLLQLSER